MARNVIDYRGFLNPHAQFQVNSYPYNYVVIRDVFHEYLAEALELNYQKLIVQGKSIGKVGEVGELIYDAINYTPTVWDLNHSTLSVFASTGLCQFNAPPAYLMRRGQRLAAKKSIVRGSIPGTAGRTRPWRSGKWRHECGKRRGRETCAERNRLVWSPTMNLSPVERIC